MMVEMGVSTTIECGPGRVLSGLNKRINREINSLNIESPEALQEAVAQIQ